jgi:hypothetical protein
LLLDAASDTWSSVIPHVVAICERVSESSLMPAFVANNFSILIRRRRTVRRFELWPETTKVAVITDAKAAIIDATAAMAGQFILVCRSS